MATDFADPICTGQATDYIFFILYIPAIEERKAGTDNGGHKHTGLVRRGIGSQDYNNNRTWVGRQGNVAKGLTTGTV